MKLSMLHSSPDEITPFRAWAMAARPRTLPASMSPVVVGIALAIGDGKFRLWPALAALAGSLLIQIGANLANDYQDYVKGTDTAERLGPTRVAASGIIPLARLKIGIVVTFGLVALVGLYLVVVGGWPILVVGVAAMLSALAYTGGPFPLGYHGLGDLFVFLFFGLAGVCGTYYVQALEITNLAVMAAVPVGTLTVAILVVNNLRDIETDAQTGKRTLAVRLGRKYTRVEYVLLLVVAYAIPLLIFLGKYWAPHRHLMIIAGTISPAILLPWLTLPLAVRLVRTLYTTVEGPRLNRALAGTANLDLIFSLLFAVGLALSLAPSFLFGHVSW